MRSQDTQSPSLVDSVSCILYVLAIQRHGINVHRRSQQLENVFANSKWRRPWNPRALRNTQINDCSAHKSDNCPSSDLDVPPTTSSDRPASSTRSSSGISVCLVIFVEALDHSAASFSFDKGT